MLYLKAEIHLITSSIRILSSSKHNEGSRSHSFCLLNFRDAFSSFGLNDHDFLHFATLETLERPPRLKADSCLLPSERSMSQTLRCFISVFLFYLVKNQGAVNTRTCEETCRWVGGFEPHFQKNCSDLTGNCSHSTGFDRKLGFDWKLLLVSPSGAAWSSCTCKVVETIASLLERPVANVFRSTITCALSLNRNHSGREYRKYSYSCLCT